MLIASLLKTFFSFHLAEFFQSQKGTQNKHGGHNYKQKLKKEAKMGEVECLRILVELKKKLKKLVCFGKFGKEAMMHFIYAPVK